MNIEQWEKRYTVRQFDKDQIPDKEKIDYISEVIQYIPSQNGVVDHIWVLLTPDDVELKQWLVDHAYNVYDDSKINHIEYFTMLSEAPYVFHSIRLTHPVFKDLKRKNTEYFRTNGFHAGVIVCQAVELGLDVAQICCNDGTLKEDFDLELYRDKIWNRFGNEISKIVLDYKGEKINISKDNFLDPSLSVAVGKGNPLTENKWSPYKDGVTFTGQKQKKWFNNFVK